MDKKRKQGYKDIAKQYEKPEHYRSINVQQYGNPHLKKMWVQEELPFKEQFYSDVSRANTATLSKDEVEKIFWNQLVNLGWRKTDIFADSKGPLTQFVLVCEDCDKSLDSVMANSLTKRKVESMTSANEIGKRIMEHKASAKGCKALPEA
jgi:hypothetical protein